MQISQPTMEYLSGVVGPGPTTRNEPFPPRVTTNHNTEQRHP
jgi:hypothetical protein